MPKMKTHSGLEKRIKRTKDGKDGSKILHRRRKMGKSAKLKRKTVHPVEVASGDLHIMRRRTPGISTKANTPTPQHEQETVVNTEE